MKSSIHPPCRVSVQLLAGLVLVTAEAGAEPARLHGVAGVTRSVGGHQGRELPWGVLAAAGAELPLRPDIGVIAQIGGVYQASGDPPEDPSFATQANASGIYGTVGVHYRPFATYNPLAMTPKTGIWGGAAAGVMATGGQTRLMLDLWAGYDFMIEDGWLAVGPALGFLHIFQPDEELRPDDANVFVLGAHGVFDTAEHLPPDTDGDGLHDGIDKCPRDPEDKDGYQDDDGCPELDNDRDQIPDTRDRCPLVPEDRDEFEDDDGCPEEDNDKDGILDAKDACPNVPEDVDQFEDDDGCPEEDNDKDGIPDAKDLCPIEPETFNDYADADGCPDSEQVRVVGGKIVLDDKVHFRTNNAAIRAVSYPLLDRLARLISEHPEYIHIEVQGHTDRRGDEKFNRQLSQGRAESVLEFLVEHGVERARLSAKGFGSSEPLVDEASERAFFMNRRVDFKVTREVREVTRTGGQADGTVLLPGRAAPRLEPTDAD